MCCKEEAEVREREDRRYLGSELLHRDIRVAHKVQRERVAVQLRTRDVVRLPLHCKKYDMYLLINHSIKLIKYSVIQ